MVSKLAMAVMALIDNAIQSLKTLELSVLKPFGNDKLTIKHPSGGTLQWRNDGKVYYNGDEINDISIGAGDIDMNGFDIIDIGQLEFTGAIGPYISHFGSGTIAIYNGTAIYKFGQSTFDVNVSLDLNGNVIQDCTGVSLLGSTYVTTIYPSSTSTAGYSIYLPPAQGTNGQTLVNDGTGNLTWGTVSGSSLWQTSSTDGLEPVDSGRTILYDINQISTSTGADFTLSSNGDILLVPAGLINVYSNIQMQNNSINGINQVLFDAGSANQLVAVGGDIRILGDDAVELRTSSTTRLETTDTSINISVPVDMGGNRIYDCDDIDFNNGYGCDWSGTNLDILGFPSTSGNLQIRANGVTGADINMFPDDRLYVDGDGYFVGDLTAASYSDNTPFYEGDALSEIKGIKGIDGEIDHSSLPTFVQRKMKNKDTNVEHDSRDLGAMISMLTVAVQQLTDRIEALEDTYDNN